MVKSCRILVLLGLPFLAAAQHLLDALKTQEYWTVYEVLQATGRIDPDTFYASVLLHAPAPRTRCWPVNLQIRFRARRMSFCCARGK